MKKFGFAVISLLLASNVFFTNISYADNVANTQSITNNKSTKIEEGYIRIHFENIKNGTGLWIWGGVDKPSNDWPNGQLKFDYSKKDTYGQYIDVKKSAKLQDIGFIVLSGGNKVHENDKTIKLPSDKINEVWVDSNFNVHLDEPLKEKNIFRIYYKRADKNYSKIQLWVWDDVDVKLGEWPNGLDFKQGNGQIYVDVKLKKDAKKIGFLILDRKKKDDNCKVFSDDFKFEDVENTKQIFIKDLDKNIYNNHYYINDVRLLKVTQLSEAKLNLAFTTLKNTGREDIKDKLKVFDKNGKEVKIDDIDIEGNNCVIKGEFNDKTGPYTVRYDDNSIKSEKDWQFKDNMYSYDGPLGTYLSKNGSVVDAYLWSPSADSVKILIYDKKDVNKLVESVELEKGKRGVWHKKLTSNKDISDYTDYLYSYEITRGSEKVMALDPYAKSLGAWNKSSKQQFAKAAFVNPDKIGTKLNFAKIKGYRNREDAIIYEVHVRDFTSDKNLKLKAPYGTYKAFIEKLDYLKKLGVTHIQLLPVLSCYNIDESNRKRSDDYLQKKANYNWGYDPQNYFSLSGMYSTNPDNPETRIKEFKDLVNEIHKRGMGVILDVVYNHTANLDIFENLEPKYYHFMTKDSKPKTNFGGGRLASTHYMTRRLMIDSIKYLMNEYKVDGFRFDMMGDHDAVTMEKIADEATKINKNVLILGEGWSTYVGDDGIKVKPSDQRFMNETNSVSVFSDDIRNALKSGYPDEGKPAFLTGKKENINRVFNNIKANPTNFLADDPGDVIQYIAAHDNLTLFDTIAVSTMKDPSKKEDFAEIEKRALLGNMIILTSQGIPFIHAGQEYGRTKQYKVNVPDKNSIEKLFYVQEFKYPCFNKDSYNAPDAINHLDWERIKDSRMVPYVEGLIKIRKSSDAFRLTTKKDVDKNVKLIANRTTDNAIGYEVKGKKDIFVVFVNADNVEREFKYDKLKNAKVLADQNSAGTTRIINPKGVEIKGDKIILAPLTGTILKIK